MVGTPFTNLFAFLPPASKPLNQVGAREGLDDGMLGYFPAISVFRGGATEANFGPEFWCPPAELSIHHGNDNDEDVDMIGSDQPNTLKPPTTTTTSSSSSNSKSPLRALSDRFNEQIAEDVVFDLVDEVDFWVQDGCPEEGRKVDGMVGSGLETEVVTNLGAGVGEGMTGAGLGGGLGGGGGEIKELVQEVE